MSSPSGTPCQVPLVCGNNCICNDTPKHPHTIHVCSNVDCRCHQVAYRMEEATTRNGERLYIPQGARLAPRKPVQA